MLEEKQVHFRLAVSSLKDRKKRETDRKKSETETTTKKTLDEDQAVTDTTPVSKNDVEETQDTTRKVDVKEIQDTTPGPKSEELEEEAKTTTPLETLDEVNNEEVPSTSKPDREQLTQDDQKKEVPAGLSYGSFTNYGEAIKSDIEKFSQSAQYLDGASSHAADQSDKYAQTLQTLQDTSKTFKVVAGHFGDVVVKEQQEHVGDIKKKLGSTEENILNDQENIVNEQEFQETPTTTPKNEEPKEINIAEETLLTTTAQIVKDSQEPVETTLQNNKNDQTGFHDEDTEQIENLEKKITFKDSRAYQEAKLNLVLSWEGNNTSLELALTQFGEEKTVGDLISISTNEPISSKEQTEQNEDDKNKDNNKGFEVMKKYEKTDNSHLAWIRFPGPPGHLPDGQFNVFVFYEPEVDPAPDVKFECFMTTEDTFSTRIHKKATSMTLPLKSGQKFAKAFTFHIQDEEVSWASNGS